MAFGQDKKDGLRENGSIKRFSCPINSPDLLSELPDFPVAASPMPAPTTRGRFLAQLPLILNFRFNNDPH